MPAPVTPATKCFASSYGTGEDSEEVREEDSEEAREREASCRRVRLRAPRLGEMLGLLSEEEGVVVPDSKLQRGETDLLPRRLPDADMGRPTLWLLPAPCRPMLPLPRRDEDSVRLLTREADGFRFKSSKRWGLPCWKSLCR